MNFRCTLSGCSTINGTGYRLNARNLFSGSDRKFSAHDHVEASSGAHQASYTIGVEDTLTRLVFILFNDDVSPISVILRCMRRLDEHGY
jgi:hypothetical protein